MATLTLIQNSPGTVVVYLQTTAGLPATGLLYTDIVVDLKKSTDTSFINKPLVVGDFASYGGGFYSIALSAANLDTLGNLYVKVIGATIRTVLEPALVVASVPATPPTLPTPDTTVIFGTIVKADGSPAINASIQARTLNVPSVFGGVAITTDPISTRTDSDGYFILTLVTGSQVDITIPSLNYRRTITVPVASADLFLLA